MNRAVAWFIAAILISGVIGTLVFLLRATAGSDRRLLLDRHEASSALNALIEQSQTQGENGWSDYADVVQAFEAVLQAADAEYEPPPPDRMDEYLNASVSIEYFRYADVPEWRLAPAREALAQLEEAGVLDQAVRLSRHTVFINRWSGQAALVDEFTKHMAIGSRPLMKGLLAAIRGAFDRGDTTRAVELLRAAFRVIRAEALELTLINRLAASSMARMTLYEIRWTLIEHDLSEDSLARVADLLRSHWPLPPIERTLAAERIFALSDPGGSMADLESLMGGRSIDRAVAEIESIVSRMHELIDIHPSRRPPFKRIDPLADPMATDPAESLHDQMIRMLNLKDALEMERRGTEIMIAIERYERRHHRLPPSLNDLIPDFIEQIPADPLGGAFIYRASSAEPAVVGYILYSVGADQTDDGGAHDENARFVSESPETSGDFVFTTTRPILER